MAISEGGLIAEHVCIAVLGVIVLAQLPRWLRSLTFLARSRHTVGPSPAEPSGVLAARLFRSARSGLLLHYRAWRPAGTPRATLYLAHGLGEHCGRYELFASGLAAAGVAVVALDHQGHGTSEGDRGHIESLNDVVADVLQLVTTVSPTPPGVPAFLMGHSMGGLIALLAAQSSPGLFTGMVLSAPCLEVDPNIKTPLNVFLARSLSSWLPKLPVQPLTLSQLSTDPEAVRQYTRDPLIYHGPLRGACSQHGEWRQGGAMGGVAAVRRPACPLPFLH